MFRALATLVLLTMFAFNAHSQEQLTIIQGDVYEMSDRMFCRNIQFLTDLQNAANKSPEAYRSLGNQFSHESKCLQTDATITIIKRVKIIQTVRGNLSYFSVETTNDGVFFIVMLGVKYQEKSKN